MHHLRRAGTDDAGALAALAERTFRDTFTATNTAENMALHCASAYGEALQRAELQDPRMTTLVCERAGELIGYAQLHWGPAPPCVAGARPAEIQRLYVAAAWHGKGIAQELMAESLRLAEAGGADQVWLGVWEHNPRAVAFYRKFGFAEVGDHVFPVGNDPQRDLVMARPIAPAASRR